MTATLLVERIDVRDGRPCPVARRTVLHRLPVIRMPQLPEVAFDICGRRRSPATFGAPRRGIKPANFGKTYPPTPPEPEQMLAILDQGSKTCPAHIRDRSIFGLLWRSGLRINEALSLHLTDIDRAHNSVLVRCGKGGKRRISGMDDFGFDLLGPWLEIRANYPGQLLFVICEGATKGRKVAAANVRERLHQWARAAGVERVIGDEVIGRVAPHQLRHGHAVDLAREGVLIPHISRQLGHSNLATTTTYLSGISNVEVLQAIAARPRPVAELPEEATA